MGDLFAEGARQPLAERMRPRTLEEFVGQEELVGPGRALRRLIESGELRSLVLWGPPGSGKTTLGWIIANRIKGNFLAFSAALSPIKEIRRAMEGSRKRFRSYGSRDVIFVDEIHRFNKAQQDVFLPFLEEGSIVLVGATTENPSLELVAPLLSRSQVFVLEPLSAEEIKKILKNALEDEERGLGGMGHELDPEAAEFIAQVCDGDARRALNILELAADLAQDRLIGLEAVQEAAQRKLDILYKVRIILVFFSLLSYRSKEFIYFVSKIFLACNTSKYSFFAVLLYLRNFLFIKYFMEIKYCTHIWMTWIFKANFFRICNHTHDLFLK